MIPIVTGDIKLRLLPDMNNTISIIHFNNGISCLTGDYNLCRTNTGAGMLSLALFCRWNYLFLLLFPVFLHYH